MPWPPGRSTTSSSTATGSRSWDRRKRAIPAHVGPPGRLGPGRRAPRGVGDRRLCSRIPGRAGRTDAPRRQPIGWGCRHRGDSRSPQDGGRPGVKKAPFAKTAPFWGL
ncbi:MAG: hypothetical protein MZV63_65970 [Marinilabiliales bacterium]|nr:hypothetical protein [Marinilabiliales bacterium]